MALTFFGYSTVHDVRDLILEQDFQEAAKHLQRVGLSLPTGITLGLGLYETGRIIATGFLAGNVLCGISVVPDKQGEGLAAFMVSRLMERGAGEGLSHFLLFTKPGEVGTFRNLSFSEIACTGTAALLEFGRPGYADWIDFCRRNLHASDKGKDKKINGNSSPGPREAAFKPGREKPRHKPDTSRPMYRRAAVVMNANPFTRGHRHLVETALQAADTAAVFVVQEDASAFPFSVRFALVCEGLADLNRVKVLPGGNFMVSLASFPSYFTGERQHEAVHASLDATIFASKVAPDLGLDLRCVGAEPVCGVTAAYNEALRRILPIHGIRCVEVPRLCEGTEVVSASTVRALLQQRPLPWEAIAKLTPASTLRYLRSDEGRALVEGLVNRSGRH